MKTFTAVVERCPETKLFVGYIPGFPGAHSQGATLEELNLNLKEVIAMLLEDGEDKSALDKVSSAPAQVKTVTPANQPALAASKPAPTMAVMPSSQSRVFASPLAKRLAKEQGVDLSRVQGSGTHGRIVKSDLLNKSGSPAQAGAQRAASAAPMSPDAKTLADAYGIPYTLSPNSAIRKIIARRLSESKQTVPHFYLTMDVEIDELLKIRKELNDAADGYKISVNDFVIKATAMALVKFPAVNVSWMDDNLVQYTRADVSVAVATPNGLITPIIKDAANKSIKDISNEMKDLAARAKDGKLKPQEFQGGTISVSNLGMFGIREFSAIINPPQGAILAVGAGESRAVVKGGVVRPATIMTVTMSVDHRAIDGAVGAEWLQVFKKLVESPVSLIL